MFHKWQIIANSALMNLRKFLHKTLVNKFLIYFAAAIIYILSWMIFLSCRKEVIRTREIEDYERSSKPMIYAFWHGRMFPTAFLRPKHRKIYTVISLHGDGELITAVLKLFGISAVRGSTDRAKSEKKTSKNRGGSRVIRESIRVLETGYDIAVTPDGPRGPRFVFKPNFVKVAATAKAPIFPVTYSASRAWVFKSWDRFMLPKPFSKIKLVYGKPVYLPEINEYDAEAYGKQIEKTLNDLTFALDAKYNILL